MSAGFSIGGLVSGLDTSSIVSQLMQIERIPIRSMQTEQAKVRASIDAFSGITTRVSALRDASRTVSSLSDFKAFVSAKSSSSAVTAVASGAAEPGSLSFTVDALATQHQLFGDNAFTAGTDVISSGNGTFTLTVGPVGNTTDHVVNTNDATTLNDLAAAINDLDAGVSAAVVTKTPGDVRLMLTSNDTGADATFSTTASAELSTDSFTTVATAANAEITFGSGGSSVTVERSTNTVGDLIAGVTLTLNQTTTSAVSVTTSRDVDAAVDAITGFVTELNSTISELKAASSNDPEAAGPLAGSSVVREVLEGIRRAVSRPVDSLGGTYSYASSVGLEVQRDGSFVLNESKLREVLAADFDAVADLFASSASATDSRVSFLNATSSTTPGTYAVQITMAASVAAITPQAFVDGGAGSFDITVGGQDVTVTLDASDNTAALVVAKINDALSTAGVSTLSASVDSGTGGVALATTTYGSASTFTVGAGASSYGIAEGTESGTDVAGTIGGDLATGTGRTLKSTAGDTIGLSLTITASPSEVSGTLDLGTVSYSAGIAGTLDTLVSGYLDSEGQIATAKDSLQDRVDLYQERIDRFEDRLVLREEYLRRQFSAMEAAISSLQQQASFFAAQLGQQSQG